MFKKIECPSVWVMLCLWFPTARNIQSVDDIDRQIYEVYGENVMSDGMVHKCITLFVAEGTRFMMMSRVEIHQC